MFRARLTSVTSICVFCSSIPEIDPAYLKSASELGELIAKRGDILVYGGAQHGSMGAVADSALAAGGHVIGIITDHLAQLEKAKMDLTELQIVPTLEDRKFNMVEHADAFVVLPGGFGTLEEAMLVITGAQLMIHSKPTIFVNTLGFWNPLIAMMDRMFERRFARPQQRTAYQIVEDPQAALRAIDEWDPSMLKGKWS